MVLYGAVSEKAKMQPNQPQRRRPDYDQALERLLARAHDGFLALIAPGLTWQGERSPELPAVARQADMVWEVHDEAGERGLLHVELQTLADEQMGSASRNTSFASGAAIICLFSPWSSSFDRRIKYPHPLS